MIHAVFAAREVCVSGHSGLSNAGEDVVCAAVTSALRLAECTINDVMNAGAHVSVSHKSADIRLSLPEGCGEAPADVIRGLRIYLSALAQEYPANIRVSVEKSYL